MRRPPPFHICRTMLAACALYALLVQGFLVGATPAAAAGIGGIICSHDASGQPRSDAPVGHDGGCCTAACAAAVAAPAPSAGFDVLTWPSRPAAAIAWRLQSSLFAPLPPRRSSSARGPPLA